MEMEKVVLFAASALELNNSITSLMPVFVTSLITRVRQVYLLDCQNFYSTVEDSFCLYLYLSTHIRSTCALGTHLRQHDNRRMTGYQSP